MKIKKLLFILFLAFALIFFMKLFNPNPMFLVPLLITLEVAIYYIFFKTQLKLIIFLPIFLCFLSTIKSVVDVITKVDGKTAMLRELNIALKFSLFHFIVTMVICIGGILIIKKVRTEHEKNH